MGVKCPSCGFDSAEGAAWCEMCKEPFGKPKPDEDLKKLAALEERLPTIPRWARLGAWVFLGLWVIFLLSLLGAYFAKYNAEKAGIPVSQSAG